MPPKEIIPALGLESYSCPHCGALANQFWFSVLPKSFEKGNKPFVTQVDRLKTIKLDDFEEKARNRFVAAILRLEKNDVTYESNVQSQYSNWEMLNLYLSRCYSCDGFGVWIRDTLIWPSRNVAIEPHPDIPGDVKADFIEAASIVNISPRGSAALARLVVQKLMSHLGGQGKDINANIASLVKQGLEPEIQMALDIVRVTGNNAVHPGELALEEDTSTAHALLQLINLVVERRIATQKRIKEMFRNLPPGALEAIKKRDGGTEG
jgi:hypothetical protein